MCHIIYSSVIKSDVRTQNSWLKYYIKLDLHYKSQTNQKQYKNPQISTFDIFSF